MRRRLALLTVTTGLVLTGAVVGAGPAAARNVGGTLPEGSICVLPGGATITSPVALSVLPCVCIITHDTGGQRNVGGTGPEGGSCPPGLLNARPPRNVGG
jgi:hypothetical protein